MSPDEIVIVSIVFGSFVAITFIGVVGSIIKAWIRKSSSKNLSENKEFLDALREFKENMDRRVSNLEAIIAGNEPVPSSVKKTKKIKENQSAIGIELDDEAAAPRKEDFESSRLRNMLNQ